jgi:predicted AAA+ superfamily ATPase
VPIYAVLRYASVNKEIIAKNVEFYNLGDYMIKRDRYLNQLINAKDNGFPKVITGVRRCGKSFPLKEIYREYLLSENIPESRIIILELDDDKNMAADFRRFVTNCTGSFFLGERGVFQ